MIKWISSLIGTGAFSSVPDSPDYMIVDVRDFVDKAGNSIEEVRNVVIDIAAKVNSGKKVVICCDYGMSRSNAIAVGVLALTARVGFRDALRTVIEKTNERNVKIEVLSKVREALESKPVYQPIVGSSSHRRLLVTGATGFIGRRLIEKTKDKYAIWPANSKKYDLQKNTLELQLCVEENYVDTIVHLASPRVYTTNEAMGASLVMLRNVLDVCRDSGVGLIFLSGWVVFSGLKANELLASEEVQPLPEGPYGATKYFSELMIANYHALYGVRNLILRCSPTYGQGGDKPKFLYNFLEKALQGQDIYTHEYLNGLPSLDLIFVEDLLEVLDRCIEKEIGGTYHVGTGRLVSTTAVAELIVEMTRSTSRILHKKIDEYSPHIAMNTSRLGRLIGYLPSTSLSEGLQSLISAYKGAPR